MKKRFAAIFSKLQIIYFFCAVSATVLGSSSSSCKLATRMRIGAFVGDGRNENWQLSTWNTN